MYLGPTDAVISLTVQRKRNYSIKLRVVVLSEPIGIIGKLKFLPEFKTLVKLRSDLGRFESKWRFKPAI